MESDVIITCCMIIGLFIGGFLLMIWSVWRKNEKQKKADSGTRIRSDMVKEKSLTDKTAREYI